MNPIRNVFFQTCQIRESVLFHLEKNRIEPGISCTDPMGVKAETTHSCWFFLTDKSIQMSFIWCCAYSPFSPRVSTHYKKALESVEFFKQTLQKSVNLQFITLGRLDDGTNESSTKCLMFQVQYYLFFMISCKSLCKNPFNLFSYFFIKLQK